VKGKTVFSADDMIGTGGTLLKGMKSLKDLGAERIICAVSLPLFSGSAIEDFEAAYRQGLFYRIIGTNAVHHRELLQKEWYVPADVTGLFAQIISSVHQNRSLSSMLDNRDLVAKRIKRQLDRMAGHPVPPVQPCLPGVGPELDCIEGEPIPYGVAEPERKKA
jgi:ribose-phosphate pyrophosphokinase